MKIDKIINLCIKYSITLNQFYLLYSKIYNKDEIINYQKIGKYKLQDFIELEEKGLITVFGNILEKETIKYSDIAHVNSDFSDQIKKDEEEASKEILDNFPDLVKVENKLYPAKNISPEDFEKYYFSIYKGDPEEHDKILKAVKNYTKSCPVYNGTTSISAVGLKKFFDSRFYLLYSDNKSGDTFNYIS
jgi:hypothetical protein